jgi:hypothetical protein
LMEGKARLMVEKKYCIKTKLLMLHGHKTSFRVGHLPKNVNLKFCYLILDNMIGLAVLRRDPAMGQLVSYYRVTVDFRTDQGLQFQYVN